MKYLKTYEYSFPYLYDIGDYVRTVYNINKTPNKFFKIIERKRWGDNHYYIAIDTYGEEYQLNSKDIKCKMTRKEIEDFDLKSSQNKYNL